MRDQADIDAERWLPCMLPVSCRENFGHSTDCPAFYRAIVAAALREKDAKYNEFEKRAFALLSESESQLAAAKAEIEELKNKILTREGVNSNATASRSNNQGS